MRVSKLRGRAEPLWLTFHHSALGAPFPQRDPGLSAILARICCLGGRRSGNRCLSESRVECTFLQILAQSPLLIACHLHNPPVVTWGAVKGAREQGAFLLTLDSSPRHLQSSWERSATQFSWASFLSGFGFQFVLARLPQCFRTVCLDHSRSFTEVH